VAGLDKNARRSDDAERARHISASEAVAFATMLLGLLNDADAALYRGEHEPASPASEPHPPPPPPAEAAPAERAPADQGPGHEDQHFGTSEAPADSPPAIHAETATTVPEDASATDAARADGVAPTHVLTPSAPLSDFSSSTDHAASMAGGAGHSGITAPSSFDLGTSIQQLADTITGLVDSSLAAVSSTLANLSATVGQLTSSLSDTVSHLTEGLTGAVTSLTLDGPAAGLLEPLASNLLGPTQHDATDFSGSTQHGASLLDTAGAIPTAALPPLPLHLGFLGQPTIDGHETHDGAFSALGVHHF
jgi:hypothetical protein